MSTASRAGLQFVDPLHPLSPRPSPLRVEQLKPDDLSGRTVVHDHARFDLIALGRLRRLVQSDVHRIVVLIVVNPHHPPASTSQRCLFGMPLRSPAGSCLVRPQLESDTDVKVNLEIWVMENFLPVARAPAR